MLKARSNIILITVDSLRSDHLGCYGYAKPSSPNLDRLAQECKVFSQAFSNGPNTPHAFPAIMAARDSLMSSKLGLFDAPMTLAEALQSVGYRTVGFNAANPYISTYFHYDRGFDEFHDYLSFSVPTQESQNKSKNYLNDHKSSVTDDSQSSLISIPELDLNHYLVSEENIRRKACLESQINADICDCIKGIAQEPFFLWVHYMDTHYPYLPQLAPQLDLGIEPISKEDNFQINTRVRENMGISSELLHKVTDLYDSAIRQVDSKIGELFSCLKQLNLYDSANIVVTSDHGEEFLEHGDMQHKSKLFDELLHVPLFIKPPKSRTSEVCDELTSLIQLAPTIISKFQNENPFRHNSIFDCVDNETREKSLNIFAGASYGKNKMIPAERQMLRVDLLPKIYCCRNKHWKLIMDKSDNQNYLFNLVTDPNELINVYNDKPAQMPGMQQQLEQQIVALDRARLTARISRVRTKLSINHKQEHAIRPSR